MNFGRAGGYRNKVKFMRNSTVLNEFREPVGSMSTVLVTFARVETQVINEASPHELILDNSDARMFIRYSTKAETILSTDRVILRGREYRILGMSYDDWNNTEIEFRITEDVVDG